MCSRGVTDGSLNDEHESIGWNCLALNRSRYRGQTKMWRERLGPGGGTTIVCRQRPAIPGYRVNETKTLSDAEQYTYDEFGDAAISFLSMLAHDEAGDGGLALYST